MNQVQRVTAYFAVIGVSQGTKTSRLAEALLGPLASTGIDGIPIVEGHVARTAAAPARSPSSAIKIMARYNQGSSDLTICQCSGTYSPLILIPLTSHAYHRPSRARMQVAFSSYSILTRPRKDARVSPAGADAPGPRVGRVALVKSLYPRAIWAVSIPRLSGLATCKAFSHF
jgi:hypothetical protein